MKSHVFVSFFVAVLVSGLISMALIFLPTMGAYQSPSGHATLWPGRQMCLVQGGNRTALQIENDLVWCRNTMMLERRMRGLP